jgi:5-methyltetrahydropteroyltriglutamate--homocysteine methyltransferase
MQTYAYGFPRLGEKREFKRDIENFWEKKISEKELIASLNKIEEERLRFYRHSVDGFPLGEFTYYDNILDTALIFGVYPFTDLTTYFEYARGKSALDLKKYFNTNYHYLAPVITKKTRFAPLWNKPLAYFQSFFLKTTRSPLSAPILS